MGYVIKFGGKTYHYDDNDNYKGNTDSSGKYTSYNGGSSSSSKGGSSSSSSSSSNKGSSSSSSHSSSSSSNNKGSSSSGSHSSSSSNNKGSSSSNDYNKVTGTTGYAEYYRQAKAQGKSDEEAHGYATWKNGGSGITEKDYEHISGGSSSSSGTNKNGYVKNDYDTGRYESDYLEELKLQEQQMEALKKQQEEEARKQQSIIDALQKQLANQRSPEEIYNEIMNQMPQTPDQQVLSYDEALGRARNELGGMYNQRSKEVLNEMDKDNLRRGFYGQLPADAIKRAKASELETQKNSAVSNLANSMVGDSKVEADRKTQLSMQEQQAQLNTLMSALQQSNAMSQSNINNLLNMYNLYDQQDNKAYQRGRDQISDQRYDQNWERQQNLDNANMTGMWNGSPTLSLQRYMADMEQRNLDNDYRQNAFDSDQEWKQKTFNANEQARKNSQALGWSNYGLSKERLEMAKQEAEKKAGSTGIDMGTQTKLWNNALSQANNFLKNNGGDYSQEDLTSIATTIYQMMLSNPNGDNGSLSNDTLQKMIGKGGLPTLGR